MGKVIDFLLYSGRRPGNNCHSAGAERRRKEDYTIGEARGRAIPSQREGKGGVYECGKTLHSA